MPCRDAASTCIVSLRDEMAEFTSAAVRVATLLKYWVRTLGCGGLSCVSSLNIANAKAGPCNRNTILCNFAGAYFTARRPPRLELHVHKVVYARTSSAYARYDLTNSVCC